MAYTNSPLVNVTLLSPNHSGQRTHAIDTITIHCVVGQCTAKRIGEIFQPTSRQASSNYGVGLDGFSLFGAIFLTVIAAFLLGGFKQSRVAYLLDHAIYIELILLAAVRTGCFLNG